MQTAGAATVEPVPVIHAIPLEPPLPTTFTTMAVVLEVSDYYNIPGSVMVDETFQPIPIKPYHHQSTLVSYKDNYLIRAHVPVSYIHELQQNKSVVQVWHDTRIAPFSCALSPCDCNRNSVQGNLPDVARYLGVDHIWSKGYKGEDIAIAVVDGGIAATGRTLFHGEYRMVNNITEGWPYNDWGTSAGNWKEHGNMCATDILGIAPNASIYDIRISGAPGSPDLINSVISNALAGYQWCINSFRHRGKPQIITNSWGMYQSAWDAAYASNPAHFFSRKVEEAINAGIIVLFAAGNCGSSCTPDPRCNQQTGTGTIWGANGHPDVMTVGAANKNETYIGYTSAGPAALDKRKPDFCSISHFNGYFPCDEGTSAATPVAAGVAALLKQAKPDLSPSLMKHILSKTAKDVWNKGWNEYSGWGIIQARQAFEALQ